MPFKCSTDQLLYNLHGEKKDYEKEHGAGAGPPHGNARRPSGSCPAEPFKLNLGNYRNFDLGQVMGCNLQINEPLPQRSCSLPQRSCSLLQPGKVYAYSTVVPFKCTTDQLLYI